MELRREDRDLAGLTVLALLWTGPRHTYDMHRMMVDWHKDFVTGLPRSMYHAVNRLLRSGLIEPVASERPGPRPERTVYALTDAGRQELRERECRLLRVPDRDSTLFVAALSFIGGLPPEEVAAALRDRTAALERQSAELDAALQATAGELPRPLLLEAEYERARADADLAWVRAVLDDLESGRLTWSPEQITRQDGDAVPPPGEEGAADD
ncbi:DNA-binding PadR family transcriptional regulator [Lipingzhangella halophila]|uniref:DNA-binding PadR family transcriptional regulator n=1 Tax=Lipingzhangella halophila TaxID=1783352 RepID=A0A7W7RM08_9ACTN|nr:helix-turn-helix transcriptional regulator [Lipingzhangella halophila]MBB4934459.1 DNA-binding PadR family transcriptional regulator [Lipingzhangella halophila]